MSSTPYRRRQWYLVVYLGPNACDDAEGKLICGSPPLVLLPFRQFREVQYWEYRAVLARVLHKIRSR